MRRLYVPLHDRELAALKTLAARERRRPQEQAAVLLGIALSPATGVQQADHNHLDPGSSDAVGGGIPRGTA